MITHDGNDTKYIQIAWTFQNSILLNQLLRNYTDSTMADYQAPAGVLGIRKRELTLEDRKHLYFTIKSHKRDGVIPRGVFTTSATNLPVAPVTVVLPLEVSTQNTHPVKILSFVKRL